MSDKIDLRIKKTKKALKLSLLTLLSRRRFNQITINDLCEEALISRATFYAHYNDKYDLLKAWLAEVKKEIIKDVYQYNELEFSVNEFIYKNQKIIKNILISSDNEILEIVQDFMSHIMTLSIKRNVNNMSSSNNIILFNFCIGGLVQLLLWQVKNNFPPEINMMNTYLYKMLECITEWDAEQEKIV